MQPREVGAMRGEEPRNHRTAAKIKRIFFVVAAITAVVSLTIGVVMTVGYVNVESSSPLKSLYSTVAMMSWAIFGLTAFGVVSASSQFRMGLNVYGVLTTFCLMVIYGTFLIVIGYRNYPSVDSPVDQAMAEFGERDLTLKAIECYGTYWMQRRKCCNFEPPGKNYNPADNVLYWAKTRDFGRKKMRQTLTSDLPEIEVVPRACCSVPTDSQCNKVPNADLTALRDSFDKLNDPGAMRQSRDQLGPILKNNRIRIHTKSCVGHVRTDQFSDKEWGGLCAGLGCLILPALICVVTALHLANHTEDEAEVVEEMEDPDDVVVE